MIPLGLPSRERRIPAVFGAEHDATDVQTSSAPCSATTSSTSTGCEEHPQEIPEFAAGHQQQLAADVASRIGSATVSLSSCPS
jgi:hypothetical protein